VTGARTAPIAAGALLGAVSGFLLWVLGVSWAVAVAIALFGIAAGIAWAGFAGGETPLFARLPADPRPGTRSDMTQVAWSLRGRHGEVSDAGVKRLRAFARARLAHHRLDLDDPGDQSRIRALLGDTAAAALIHGSVRTIADVERCLDALETLDAAAVPARTKAHRRG